MLIADDILKAFSYIPNGLIAGGLLCLVTWACKGRNRKAAGFYPAVFCFGVYMVILSHLVFFGRREGSREGVSLTLFATMGKGSEFDAFVVENLLLFIPFGALLPCMFGSMKMLRCCIWAGFLCSVSIELLQLFTRRGYCQLDDVVMNTLGTACGWFVYKRIAAFKGSRRS